MLMFCYLSKVITVPKLECIEKKVASKIFLWGWIGIPLCHSEKKKIKVHVTMMVTAINEEYICVSDTVKKKCLSQLCCSLTLCVINKFVM